MFEAEVGHGVEPMLHQLRIALGIDPATIFGEEGTFGDDVQACEQGQAFVEDGAHDMGVSLAAEEFEGEQASEGVRGREHFGAGQIAASEDAVEAEFGEGGQEQKQTAELGAQASWLEIHGSDIGAVGGGGLGALGSFGVTTSGQFGEAFASEKGGDRNGGAFDTLVLQGCADVINGLVLLAKLDDPLSNRVVELGTRARRFEEEWATGLLAEIVDQLMEAADRVAEASRDHRPGDLIDEVSSQGFVLPVRGVFRMEKERSQIH